MVVSDLAEWSNKYPRGGIYSIGSKMDNQLIVLEERAKALSASLPTAQPTEVYVAVEEGYTHFVYNANEADRVKKAKAILIPE